MRPHSPHIRSHPRQAGHYPSRSIPAQLAHSSYPHALAPDKQSKTPRLIRSSAPAACLMISTRLRPQRRHRKQQQKRCGNTKSKAQLAQSPLTKSADPRNRTVVLQIFHRRISTSATPRTMPMNCRSTDPPYCAHQPQPVSPYPAHRSPPTSLSSQSADSSSCLHKPNDIAGSHHQSAIVLPRG